MKFLQHLLKNAFSWNPLLLKHPIDITEFLDLKIAVDFELSVQLNALRCLLSQFGGSLLTFYPPLFFFFQSDRQCFDMFMSLLKQPKFFELGS